jgi:predicted ATPase
MLEPLPKTPERGEQELNVLMTLGPALLATRGWSSDDARTAFQRARELCERTGDRRKTFGALWGIWLFYTASADIPSSHKVLDELFRIAQLEADEDLLMEAHHASWGTITWLGQFDTALNHVEKGLAIYDPVRHRSHATRFGGHDPGVCGKCQEGITRWFVGQVDYGLTCCEQGLELSRTLSHPPTEAHALNWLCNVLVFRREFQAVVPHAQELLNLSTAQGLMPFAIMSRRILAWAKLEAGQIDEGVAELEQAITHDDSIGFRLSRPLIRTWLGKGAWMTLSH